MPVNKVTWAQVGRVPKPGRYLFTFGWLTITADDLAIWEAHPKATFTLYSTTAKAAENADQMAEEFRLGSFDLGEGIPPSEK